MGEPIYISQTFDADTVSSENARNEWAERHFAEAKAKGGVWPRLTQWSGIGPSGLLLEVWDGRPDNESEPRWSFATQEPKP